MSYCLDDRLTLAAGMVREGVRVADVGCDHAYLSIYLVKNKIASSVVASDVRVGPLDSAKNNVAKENLCKKIKTVLSDGLDNIGENEFDDVIICGMGGILICDILSRAPYLKDGSKRLILQPMTDAEMVREWLFDNGFEIIKERAARVSGHIYSVINAYYVGKPVTKDSIGIHLGGLIDNAGETEKAYINKYIKTLETRLCGINKAKQPELQKKQELECLISQIKEVIQ